MYENFHFSFNQKRGLVLVLLLLGLMAFARYMFTRRESSLDTIRFVATAGPSVQVIDINRADSMDWLSLPGIGPALTRRILRYRRALDGFAAIEELKKVYGLNPELFTQIEPYLSLAEAAERKPAFAYNKRTYTPIEPIDLNLADSALLTSLPAIGPVMSRRILRYRAMVRGFSTHADLDSIYGLKPEQAEVLRKYTFIDSTTLKQYVAGLPKKEKLKREYPTRSLEETKKETNTPEPGTLSGSSDLALLQLPINTADSATLETLPGIGAKLASRIVKLRTILGFYHSVDQLKAVYGLSPENFEKMKPYLSVGDIAGYPRKDLNMISLKQLHKYPSLKGEQAELVYAYRRKIGRFASWEEVSSIPGLSAAALNELKIYCKL